MMVLRLIYISETTDIVNACHSSCDVGLYVFNCCGHPPPQRLIYLLLRISIKNVIVLVSFLALISMHSVLTINTREHFFDALLHYPR
jgi:hypothetical protein